MLGILLGVASAQLGKYQAGIQCIRLALAIEPDWPEAHNNLGNALRDQGDLNQAVACFRRCWS